MTSKTKTLGHAKPKKTHFAEKINQRGGVSALCFKNPRAIDLSKSTWTLSEENVNCKKCLKLLNKND